MGAVPKYSKKPPRMANPIPANNDTSISGLDRNVPVEKWGRHTPAATPIPPSRKLLKKIFAARDARNSILWGVTMINLRVRKFAPPLFAGVQLVCPATGSPNLEGSKGSGLSTIPISFWNNFVSIYCLLV
jgi:hypothetical protein